MSFFTRWPKTTNFAKLTFGMYVGNKICDTIYYNKNKIQYPYQKEYLLSFKHKVTTLKNKDGKFINLLGEKHFKSDLEMQECNKLIFNNDVQNILFEQYKPDYLLGEFACSFNYSYLMAIIKKYKLENEFKNTSSIYVANNSQKKCHNLELNSHGKFSDNLSFLSNAIFGLTPFILFAKPNLAIKIMSVTFSHNLFDSLMEYPTDYKTKSFISKIFLIDRILYRRDYVMANNIIKYMDENKDKNDVPLCIFGVLHNEGIIYYLEQNGYEIIGESRIF
jgi:hypothetical protein